MRLDKFLCDCGIGTRKEVKKLIKSGAISVCDEIITDSAFNFDEQKSVVKKNSQIISYEKYIYLMMNKPKGYISATDDKKKKTVLDLLSDEYKYFNLFPAGRLDIDTEGFLLLTNDGDFAHNILSPKKHVSKTYYAIIDGTINDEHIEMFNDGIVIDGGYKTMPAKLEILKSDNESEIEITICEGKFHQIKRMFEAIGTTVIYLKRIAMGSLCLDESLELGDVKKLTQQEVLQIRNEETKEK